MTEMPVVLTVLRLPDILRYVKDFSNEYEDNDSFKFFKDAIIKLIVELSKQNKKTDKYSKMQRRYRIF